MAQTKTAQTSNQNLLGALAYLGGFVTGLILLLVEKKDKFVRFHAMQSTIFFGGVFILNVILGFIPLLGWLVGFLIWVVSVVLWVVLMVKAYQGEYYKLPYIGDLAEQQLRKVG